MQDITRRLDAELAAPPAPRHDVATTLTAGRKALRRRRLAAGGAALAVLAVVGGSAYALSDLGSGPPGGSYIASEQVGDTEVRTVEKSVLPAGDILQWEVDDESGTGVLLLREGWQITDQVEDPAVGTEVFNNRPIADSVALELTKGDTVWWALSYRLEIERDGNSSSWGGSSVMAHPHQVTFDFDRWVDLHSDLATTSGTDELVAFDGDRLVPLSGVEILHQEPVALGKSFARGGPQVAARVSTGEAGVFWLVARSDGGGADGAGTEVIVAQGFDTEDDPSFAEFVTYLERIYGTDEQGGSEGLR